MNHQESRNADTSLYCLHCSCFSHTLPRFCCGSGTFYLSQQEGEKWRCTTCCLCLGMLICVSCNSAQVENWSRYKSNWSTKKEPSSPSNTSARKGEGSQTLVVMADAASGSTVWSREQGEGKEQNRWGEETEWVTGGDSRSSVTPKAQIPFAVLKTNHYFHYTVPSPHTHTVGWITVMVREELPLWWIAGRILSF